MVGGGGVLKEKVKTSQLGVELAENWNVICTWTAVRAASIRPPRVCAWVYLLN